VEPPQSEDPHDEGSAAGGAPEGDEHSPLGEEPVGPPQPRDSVLRAHRAPTGREDRTGYLRLDLGESVRPASPRVLQALQQLAPEDLCRYPDSGPLCARLALLHGVEPQQVIVTAGSDEAIRWTFAAFVEEGARVAIPRPTFGAFLTAAEAAGAFVERVDYREDLSFPVDEFRKLLSPRTPRMAVLANPNAPTGTTLPDDTVLDFARNSPTTLFLVNESFASYQGHSLLERDELPANLLVLRSLSKDYGLAGLRIGYLVGDPEVISALQVVRPSHTVSTPSLRAAAVALDEGESMQQHVAEVRAIMDRLVSRLESRSIQARATAANFVLVKLSSPIQPWAAAFAAHKILVGTWGHVGPMAPYIRVTVNSDQESARFLDTLDLVLHQGIPGASWVEGVPGEWSDLGSEGMA
jgi:histidinol-phosphate aminotransferase